MKKRSGFVIVIFALSGVTMWAYFHFFRENPTNVITDVPSVATSSVVTTTTVPVGFGNHGPCLEENEVAEYPLKSTNEEITEPVQVPVPIVVKDVLQKDIRSSFQIENVRSSYHPMEVHRCGIYVVRAFNYNPEKADQAVGYRYELWKYDYRGIKQMLILLAEKPGEFISYYGSDFRVSPQEIYIALDRGYLGKENYALIVKNLNTLEDVFVLPIQEIEKRNPDLVQNISFTGGGWTNEGRYFWADTHYGANTLGFIRIDIQTKTFDLFPAPKDVLGGDALNLEKGLITVHPGNVWFGVAQIEEQEKAKRHAQGISTELYIHNLFTDKRTFVASTTEPLYYFQPIWISDTELQYTLPSSATTTYKIPQQ